MRKTTALAVALIASTMLLVGCIPPPPAPPDPVPPVDRVRDEPVGFQTYNFVDPTRGIPPLDDFPGTDVRPIPTSVWYPTDRSHAPYPLVVFAHGYGVDPGYYAPLLSRIASAGYVVAAPTYPILSGWPAGPSDFVDWSEKFPDTWFATTSVLDLSANGDPTLGGMIDPQRIAVAGHSDGALISFSDGFVAWRNDWRVRAVISYAALLDEPGTTYQPNGRAFLHFASDNDVYNDLGDTIAWDHDNLAPPTWTIGLWNADHSGPYTDPSDPHFDVVARATIDFLDQELKGQSPLGLYLDVVSQPDLAAFL
jgi:dienelactone hydrolase